MNRREEQLIGPMAAFIGARLQYPCPGVNGQGNPWTSTIRVDQHKEKFWAIRVYCTLAADEMVLEKWNWMKDREKRIAAGEKFYERLRDDVIKAQLKDSDEPTPEFKARCLLHDALHYRKCYREMVALQPQLQMAICGQADHTELLWPTYDEMTKRFEELASNSVEYMCQKYGQAGLPELKEFLRKVYDPSIKDYMELRD